MLKEFKEFILRGNVVDLAVAVIIGGAFGAIVTSLTNDIIMPLIGVLLGGIDFSSLTIQIGEATIAYGNFIQAIINFLIIGLVLFFVVKAMNKAATLGAKKEAAAPAAPEDIKLLTEDSRLAPEAIQMISTNQTCQQSAPQIGACGLSQVE